MKPGKFILFVIALLLSSGINAQDPGTTGGNQEKKNQSELFNEVYAGYGAGGLFYWTGRMKHKSDYPSENYSWQLEFSDPKSVGTFMVGYQRSMGNVVTLGMLFGIQNFSYTGEGFEYTYNGYYTDTTYHSGTYNDLLLMGIARVNFSYVNKPALKLYSGIGIGVTVDFGIATDNGKDYSERRLWPAGQLTLMGVRFGRAFGGFFEFGIGTFGILNAGISYKFSD